MELFPGMVDGLCTTVMQGRMAKLIIWYDNETSFTHQFLRLLRRMSEGN